MLLGPKEQKLVGEWRMEDGQVKGNAACDRIRWLTHNQLKKVADREEGWTTLWLDEADGRYWELTYPNSEWHGAGPPTLEALDVETVKQLYGLSQAPS